MSVPHLEQLLVAIGPQRKNSTSPVAPGGFVPPVIVIVAVSWTA
jgi:hypothetical protein